MDAMIRHNAKIINCISLSVLTGRVGKSWNMHSHSRSLNLQWHIGSDRQNSKHYRLWGQSMAWWAGYFWSHQRDVLDLKVLLKFFTCSYKLVSQWILELITPIHMSGQHPSAAYCAIRFRVRGCQKSETEPNSIHNETTFGFFVITFEWVVWLKNDGTAGMLIHLDTL